MNARRWIGLGVSVFVGLSCGVSACSAGSETNGFDDGSGSGGEGQGGSGQAASGGGDIGGGIPFDGGGPGNDGGPVAPTCKVVEASGDAVPDCTQKPAPADSFAPQVQWTWTAPPAAPGSMFTGSFITPLVGNFTDDNQDGAIDLCDVPDILISAVATFDFGGMNLVSNATLHLLAGDTGQLEVTFPVQVDAFVNPAFGDIDGDGIPEILAADPQARLIAFEHDGTLKWTGDQGGYRASFATGQCTTLSLYDLDGDGSVEILFGFEVFNAQGKRLWGLPGNAAEHDGSFWCVTPTAADLDGDGKLEVIFGHQTFRADGSLLWALPGFKPAHPQVANLDEDADPELFLTNMDGITIVEHTGTVKLGPVRPTDPTPAPNCWGKPAVVHDFDGDGKADLATGTCTDYSVYNVAGASIAPKWSANVQDLSGLATATAFDFLGDAVAEAIYADETQVYVFDGLTGKVALTAPRSSGTLIEYPVVADVDNDGSAEIVYVSNYTGGQSGPTVTVLRDAEERWIPARRVWNQHAYHVTNVREDGTIPKVMKKSWLGLNTFRTNSQIGSAGDCSPEPPK